MKDTHDMCVCVCVRTCETVAAELVSLISVRRSNMPGNFSELFNRRATTETASEFGGKWSSDATTGWVSIIYCFYKLQKLEQGGTRNEIWILQNLDLTDKAMAQNNQSQTDE